MTGRRLRVAVVGAGFFAQFHHEAWSRLDRVDLVGICDLDRTRADAAALASGTQGFDDLDAMLDATQADVVDIATPPETHLALVAAVAERGLPVICQKPLAPTLDEARAVAAAASSAGVPLAVHENFRFQPWFREARRLIDAGQLGDLHGITFRMRPGDGQGPHAYLDRQPYFQTMERFLVHETAIHFVDTFRFLMGEVASVYADLRRLNPVIAGEDAGTIVFRFAGGQSGVYDANRLNDHVSDNPRRTMGEMWLEGVHGVLRLEGSGRLWWKPHGEDEVEHPYAWNDRGFGGDCVFATQAHIAAHLLDGTPLESGAEDYLRNVEIEEAIYRSAAERRAIDL
jgi:predicted dehydrogenase